MSKVPKINENRSGSVTIDGNKIVWEFEGEMLSIIELSEIAVIGEYTTADGPCLDDWFLVFVRKDGSYSQVPLYEDCQDALWFGPG